MDGYIVTNDKLELPRDTRFMTLSPLFQVEIGDLALFKVSGTPIVGRSYLGVDGPGWIQLPGIQITLSDEPVEIIGAVVPVEMEIEPDGYLAKYESFREGLFPQWLAA